MRYYIAQVRLGQEQAVRHAIETNWPQLDVYNPSFLRPNSWSNRPSDHQPVAYFFPRYMFVSASMPWQEVSRVPGLTLVLHNSEPVTVPLQFIETMRRQEVTGHVCLAGVYLRLSEMPNHERAKVLIWMFDKDWDQYRDWGDIMVAQGLFTPVTEKRAFRG